MPRAPFPRSRRGPTILVLTLLLLPALAGCATPDPAPPPGADGDANPPPEDGSNLLPAKGELPDANGTLLIDLVERQVYRDPSASDPEPRYRTPGTPGHEAAIPILASMLRERGLWVTTERFEADVSELGEVNVTNVYGVRNGTGDGEIWLAAHWDSRAWADADSDEDKREQPVLGANDGAAAVAVVTHVLDLLPETNATIRVALFDAEDQGKGHSGWVVGSTHAAETRSPQRLAGITALLLVDMPGDEDLLVRREGNSHADAPELTDLVFTVADRLDAQRFENATGPAILDDHVAFLQAGVPAVDLIHLDRDNQRGPFPWTHHTTHDTVENLDPASMAEVTEVVAATTVAIDRGAYPAS